MSTPTTEQFDAMNDAEFCAWWDAAIEAVQAQAVSEEEVVAAMEERRMAEGVRFAADREAAAAVMAAEPDNGDRFW